MYNFTIESDFKQLFPQFIGAAITAQVTNTPSNEYLWKHIPKVIRLLKAERIVISQYQSPDLLEVGCYSCGFLLIVYF